MHGSVCASLGPEFAQQRAPATAALASGFQRGTGLSKWSLPPLHASGLSKEEHISDSARIPSPSLQTAPLDRDLAFCARATGLLGPCVAQWRDAQVKVLSQVAARLRPWELQLVKQMPPSVACVASQKRPAFMLMCAILLRWPDPLHALRFVTGYKVVGDIEHSGLFTPVEVDMACLLCWAPLP